MNNDQGQFYNPQNRLKMSRHRLPHWHQTGTCCFVTWRLADSLPKDYWTKLKCERDLWLINNPEPWDDTTEREYHRLFHDSVDEHLDHGHGSCHLKSPEIRRIVADAFAHFCGERYEIISYVIMPNHVHILFFPLHGYRLSDIVKSWKGFTGRAANKRLGTTGKFWQEEFWDRLIRNEKHFSRTKKYIRHNPLKLRPGSFTLFEA